MIEDGYLSLAAKRLASGWRISYDEPTAQFTVYNVNAFGGLDFSRGEDALRCYRNLAAGGKYIR